uniref:C-type lectin domain-containing protein n=1 Tax=Seriola lalandi dorsalis TaxID=1841481 RepID=A0A3B4XVW6_SERLL
WTTNPLRLTLLLSQCHSRGVQLPRASQCPPGWLANGRSCFTVRRTGFTWNEAQHSCKHLAAGSHLADLKTQEDLLFVSSHLYLSKTFQ